MKFDVKSIAYNGLIASIYVVLTLISYPISFMGIQFRIAEILILLCFFRKDYTIGLTCGCIIANLFSSIGLIDVLFGGLATLLSCLLVSICKHLILSVTIPVIINGLVVGYELFRFLNADFVISCLTVALGEVVVLMLGYMFIILFRKKEKFFDIIRANQNINFKF